MLVSVNETDGTLTVYGEVNHSSLYDRDDNGRYWWNDQNIRRSIFMGDYVYAISSAGVTATNLTTLEETARVTLSISNPYADSSVDDVAVASSDSDRDDEEASEDRG